MKSLHMTKMFAFFGILAVVLLVLPPSVAVAGGGPEPREGEGYQGPAWTGTIQGEWQSVNGVEETEVQVWGEITNKATRELVTFVPGYLTPFPRQIPFQDLKARDLKYYVVEFDFNELIVIGAHSMVKYENTETEDGAQITTYEFTAEVILLRLVVR